MEYLTRKIFAAYPDIDQVTSIYREVRSRDPLVGDTGDGGGGGAEGEEWAELWPEPELGEGVSRVTETAASSAGRSAVMMEDTARRLGGRLNKDIVSNISFIY